MTKECERCSWIGVEDVEHWFGYFGDGVLGECVECGREIEREI